MPGRPAIPLGSPQDLFQNYAADPKMAKRAADLVIPMIKRARRNRIKIDERNRRRYNMWALLSDEKFYRGRADAYIPAFRKGVERLVTGAMRETFPSDHWWDGEATAPEYEKNVDGMKLLMDIQLKRQINLKRKARPFYRQLFIYGTSPLKVSWRIEESSEAQPFVGPDGPMMRAVKKTTYDGPDIEAVDFFSFFMYPETCQDVDRCRLVFEDIITDIDELEGDPNYVNLKQVKGAAGSGASGSEALIKRQERLRRLGITEDELNDEHYLFLTECYPKFDFKDGLGLVPAIITLAWESECVRLQRNTYGRPPYRVGKDNEMVDEAYGHARGEMTDRLQIILNDSVNQDQDASTFANNPVMVVDPNYCEDYQSIALFPGAKIPAPPEAVKFDRPPDAAYGQKEKIAYYARLIDECLGSPTSTSASPAASGQPRGARTFGGMQLLQQLASSDTKEIVEFQEDLVWEPLLGDIARMNAMFLSDEKTLRMTGTKGAPLVVNRETFKGDYAYEWKGTETVRNQTLLSAQMLVALNIMRGINPATTGGRIPNIAFVFEEWWSFQGLKGKDKLFLGTPPISVEPRVEHELLGVGRAITVSPLDNDAQHSVAHMQFLQTLQPGSPEFMHLQQHLQEHQESAVHKQMAQQMLAMQQAQGPPLQPLPHGYSVNLKGDAPSSVGARLTGGPQPNGARAGVKPMSSETSGMAPARTMAGMPGGM